MLLRQVTKDVIEHGERSNSCTLGSTRAGALSRTYVRRILSAKGELAGSPATATTFGRALESRWRPLGQRV